MKTLLVFIFFFISILFCQSADFRYNNYNESELRKSATKITHLSSKNLNNDQIWNDLNKKLNIIYWSDNIVHTFDISSAGNHGFKSFDLEKYHYIL